MAENVSSSSPQETLRDHAPPVAPPEPQRRLWTTEELLGQEREVQIQHGEDLYRLRITRHGKLILYK